MRLAAAGGALLLVSAHTPYGQWSVYRKRYLLILSNRADPPSHVLGKKVAALLAAELPASKARVSRAPHAERIASLISSKQMDVALMRPDAAAALRKGVPPFQDYGPVRLRTIAGLGEYLLVCREDFAARHAYLIIQTLSANRPALQVALAPSRSAAQAPEPRIPLHEGTLAYVRGAPLPPEPPEPAAPTAPAAPAAPDHGHSHD